MKTNMMGLELSNPVVVAPGPWTRGYERLKKTLSYNAGAIVTETIVGETCKDTRPRYAYDRTSKGLQNIRIYTEFELERWLDELKAINEAKRFGSSSKLIASVMGSSASELSYIARKVAKTGVDGIEIGMACPMGDGPNVIASDPVKVYEYTKAVVDSVDVPVSVKLTAMTGSLAGVVRAAESGGASGICAIDTLRCILDIDINTGKPSLATYGGYSGKPLKPVGLATVASISQCTELPVIGMGGICDYNDLIQYIMLGASAGGIGTEILLHGYDVIGKVINQVEDWLSEKDIKSLDDIKGKSLGELKAFEEIKREEKTAQLIRECNCGDCNDCVSMCMDNAITRKDGELLFHKDKCDGCGICLDVCPEGIIHLAW